MVFRKHGKQAPRRRGKDGKIRKYDARLRLTPCIAIDSDDDVTDDAASHNSDGNKIVLAEDDIYDDDEDEEDAIYGGDSDEDYSDGDNDDDVKEGGAKARKKRENKTYDSIPDNQKNRRIMISYYYSHILKQPDQSTWGGRDGTIATIINKLSLPTGSTLSVRRVLLMTDLAFQSGQKYEGERVPGSGGDNKMIDLKSEEAKEICNYAEKNNLS